jgi:hypothetical protein
VNGRDLRVPIFKSTHELLDQNAEYCRAFLASQFFDQAFWPKGVPSCGRGARYRTEVELYGIQRRCHQPRICAGCYPDCKENQNCPLPSQAAAANHSLDLLLELLSARFA